MRQMSFALTTQQMLAGTKTVTRRLGWANLKPGTLLQAVEKSQGLRKGEKVRKLGVIRVVSVRREQICALVHENDYSRREVASEGFDMSPAHFVAMFCRHMACDPTTVVTRIEFEHVAEEPKP